MGHKYVPAPAPPEDMAVMYIFMQPTTWTAQVAEIIINDNRILYLPEEGYTWIYISPGKHMLSAGTNALQPIEINIEGGNTYYVEYRNGIGTRIGGNRNPVTGFSELTGYTAYYYVSEEFLEPLRYTHYVDPIEREIH